MILNADSAAADQRNLESRRENCRCCCAKYFARAVQQKAPSSRTSSGQQQQEMAYRRLLPEYCTFERAMIIPPTGKNQPESLCRALLIFWPRPSSADQSRPSMTVSPFGRAPFALAGHRRRRRWNLDATRIPVRIHRLAKPSNVAPMGTGPTPFIFGRRETAADYDGHTCSYCSAVCVLLLLLRIRPVAH